MASELQRGGPLRRAGARAELFEPEDLAGDDPGRRGHQAGRPRRWHQEAQTAVRELVGRTAVERKRRSRSTESAPPLQVQRTRRAGARGSRTTWRRVRSRPRRTSGGFMLRGRSGLSAAQVHAALGLDTVTKGVLDHPVVEAAMLRLFTPGCRRRTRRRSSARTPASGRALAAAAPEYGAAAPAGAHQPGGGRAPYAAPASGPTIHGRVRGR